MLRTIGQRYTSRGPDGRPHPGHPAPRPPPYSLGTLNAGSPISLSFALKRSSRSAGHTTPFERDNPACARQFGTAGAMSAIASAHLQPAVPRSLNPISSGVLSILPTSGPHLVCITMILTMSRVLYSLGVQCRSKGSTRTLGHTRSSNCRSSGSGLGVR